MPGLLPDNYFSDLLFSQTNILLVFQLSYLSLWTICFIWVLPPKILSIRRGSCFENFSLGDSLSHQSRGVLWQKVLRPIGLSDVSISDTWHGKLVVAASALMAETRLEPSHTEDVLLQLVLLIKCHDARWSDERVRACQPQTELNIEVTCYLCIILQSTQTNVQVD